MRPPSPLILKGTIESELERLTQLLVDCDDFLDSWKEHEPYYNQASSVAMVAIMELKVVALERQAFLVQRDPDEKLPF